MLRDIRLAIRRLWFRPSHTAAIILIVGIGIGAATAVFSVVDQTILRPPPFAHADRLVQVLDVYRSSGARSTSLTLAKIGGWQQQRSLFDAFEGYAFREVDLTGGELEPERIRGLVVTNGLLRMLGVQPSLGREFTAADGAPGREAVVLISESLWKRKFGGRPEVLGMRVSLSDVEHTIIGVMPRRFRIGGDAEDLWLPIAVGGGGSPRGPSRYAGLARRAASVDVAAQQTLADTLAARLQQETPLPAEPFWDINLSPKKVATVAPPTEIALFVLLGAVGFVLLITCANTASLLLSQIGVRQRESAIRAAIGASRGRLFREVLTESVILAGCGGAVGILLATWGVDAIVAAAPPNLAYNATSPIEVDGRILAVSAGMTILTGLLFGLAPALRASAPNVDAMLKSAAGSGGRTAQSRFSTALVVGEVAFSLILLVGAALMVRTFVNLHALDRGFDGNGVVAVSLSLPTDKYVGEGVRSSFFESLRDRLTSLPGVSAVAVARDVFGGEGIYYGTVQEVEGGSSTSSAPVRVVLNSVTTDYFRALRIPIVAGHTFRDADTAEAVVISKSLADRLWPDGSAVGRGFRLGSGYPWRTVVGVAGDIEPRAGGEADTSFRVYNQFAAPSSVAGNAPSVRGYAGRVVIVRTDNMATVPGIRAAVWSIDRNQPVGRVALVSDIYADAFGRERFVLQLMTAFAAIALALTAAGIFGVLAQIVARRTREIGVRVALGARGADVVRLIAGSGVQPVLIGTVLGLAGAVVLSRFLRALLFQVGPTDPLSFTLVTLAMIAVALLACWLPIRRALHVDPAAALRVD